MPKPPAVLRIHRKILEIPIVHADDAGARRKRGLHLGLVMHFRKRRKPEGVNILYSRGCDWTEEIETKYSELGDERAWEYEILHRKVDSGEKADKAEALNLAKQADVIVAAVGENVMLCGENRDRQGLRLPGKQEQFVEELIKTGKPVVLRMFGGRAVLQRSALPSFRPGILVRKAAMLWPTSLMVRYRPQPNSP